MLNVYGSAEFQQIRQGKAKFTENQQELVPTEDMQPQSQARVRVVASWQVVQAIGVQNHAPATAFQAFIKEISHDMRDLSADESQGLADFYRNRSRIIKKLY